MTRIVVNEAAMCLRANRRTRAVGIDELRPREEETELGFQNPDSCPSPEQNYSRCAVERILSFSIRQLPQGLRTAIQLCYLDERSLTETAQMMGLSVSTVKARLLRGRTKLRETLRRFTQPAGAFKYETFEIGAHTNTGSSSRAAVGYGKVQWRG